jgi:hypothetical protein
MRFEKKRKKLQPVAKRLRLCEKAILVCPFYTLSQIKTVLIIARPNKFW